MSATVEEVHSDHSSHDGHDHGHGHDHDHDHDHDHSDHEDPTSAAALDKIQSRSERKARKALISLGLKRVPGITRVTLRRPKNVLFVLASPEVFKSQNSECYIVFGEAKIEDMNQQAQLAAAQQMAASQSAAGFQQSLEQAAEDAAGDDKVPELEAAQEEEGEVDESGLEPKDIELVMTQVNCTRAKAVKALRESGGDLINAIMAASE
jgi:nascent polypeptide-associated complex subunit alpha